MKFLKYLIAASLLVISLQDACGHKPWDMVLIDISSDMEIRDSGKENELDMARLCIRQLSSKDVMPDSIMVFAEGRAIVSTKELTDGRLNLTELRNIIGDGTSIYDALAACMGMEREKKRAMVISNSREGQSSLSSNTLVDFLKSHGMRVDAIIVSDGCDSVYMTPINDQDSVAYSRMPISNGLEKIVRRTGGELVTLRGSDDIASRLTDFLSSVSANNFKPSEKKRRQDSGLAERILSRMRPQKIYICEVDTSCVIKYGEDNYDGLYDLLAATRENPNILADNIIDLNEEISKPFNIVFSGNSSAHAKKQAILNNFKPAEDFCKLRQDTPLELLPMIYYKGTGGTMLLCGLPYKYSYNNDEDEGEDKD